LPRRINRLCDFALLVGYADNLDHVTESQIDAVAEELSLAA
jgi:type II secretory pathway predicted ATPase ExeA